MLASVTHPLQKAVSLLCFPIRSASRRNVREAIESVQLPYDKHKIRVDQRRTRLAPVIGAAVGALAGVIGAATLKTFAGFSGVGALGLACAGAAYKAFAQERFEAKIYLRRTKTSEIALNFIHNMFFAGLTCATHAAVGAAIGAVAAGAPGAATGAVVGSITGLLFSGARMIDEGKIYDKGGTYIDKQHRASGLKANTRTRELMETRRRSGAKTVRYSLPPR